MNLEERLKRAITQRKDDVFVRKEFERFGSAAQVSRALKQLTATGKLVKLGVGIYAKAKLSVLTGKPIPVRPVDVLAYSALEKLGVTVMPSRLTAEYNSGKSTQIPAGTVLNTGDRKITRKIGFGGRYVEYEKACTRPN
jgi:hypothetical protein